MNPTHLLVMLLQEGMSDLAAQRKWAGLFKNHDVTDRPSMAYRDSRLFLWRADGMEGAVEQLIGLCGSGSAVEVFCAFAETGTVEQLLAARFRLHEHVLVFKRATAAAFPEYTLFLTLGDGSADDEVVESPPPLDESVGDLYVAPITFPLELPRQAARLIMLVNDLPPGRAFFLPPRRTVSAEGEVLSSAYGPALSAWADALLPGALSLSEPAAIAAARLCREPLVRDALIDGGRLRMLAANDAHYTRRFRLDLRCGVEPVAAYRRRFLERQELLGDWQDEVRRRLLGPADTVLAGVSALLSSEVLPPTDFPVEAFDTNAGRREHTLRGGGGLTTAVERILERSRSRVLQGVVRLTESPVEEYRRNWQTASLATHRLADAGESVTNHEFRRQLIAWCGAVPDGSRTGMLLLFAALWGALHPWVAAPETFGMPETYEAFWEALRRLQAGESSPTDAAIYLLSEGGILHESFMSGCDVGDGILRLPRTPAGYRAVGLIYLLLPLGFPVVFGPAAVSGGDADTYPYSVPAFGPAAAELGRFAPGR